MSPLEHSPLYQAHYAHLRGRGLSLPVAARRYRASQHELKRAIANGYLGVLFPKDFALDVKVSEMPATLRVDESHVACLSHLWRVAASIQVPPGATRRYPPHAVKPEARHV